jgi:O-antigen/teichoic acid export membrane protein
MKRYLNSIIEQGLWSLLNLGVTLLLGRLVAPEQFGAFIFWSSSAYVLSSLQNAISVCHIQVLAPGDGDDPERRPIEQLMLVVNAAYLVAVAVAVAGVTGLLALRGSAFGALTAAIYAPAFLLQQYVRALCFSRGQSGVAAVQTGMVLVLGVALLAAGYLLFKPMTAVDILALLGCAYGVVGVFGMVRATRGQWSGLSLGMLHQYGPYARQSAWIFLGVTTTEILARFYVFATSGLYDVRTLAMLSFSQTFLRPVPLLASSWGMVARNDLVRRRDAADWRGFVKILLIAAAAGLVVSVLWSGFVYQVWPLITHYLFGGKYGDARWMLPLWGISVLFSFWQVVTGTALQVVRQFKALALANAAASVVAAAGILWMMHAIGAKGAILGTATGQALEAVVMTTLLVMFVRREWPQKGAKPTAS